VVLKGVAIALRAFGRLGLRYNHDIDLLIPPEQMKHAIDLLERNQYIRVPPHAGSDSSAILSWLDLHKDVELKHVRHGTIVELHGRLFDNPTLVPKINQNLQPQFVPLTKNARYQALPIDLEFTFLCVHGAEHAWSRLKWLADLGALLSQTDDTGVEHFYRVASGYGMARAAALAITLCAQLLETPLPPTIARFVASDWRVRYLRWIAIRSLTVGHGTTEIEATRFGTTLKNVSHYLLADGWRYWWSEIKFDWLDTSNTQGLVRVGFLGSLLRPFLWVLHRALHARRAK
jgi:hypothetical protein